MQQLLIRVAPADADAVSGALFEAGAAGFEERTETGGTTCLVVYGETREQLEQLRAALEQQLEGYLPLERLLGFELRELNNNYEKEWLAHLRPEWLTPTLVIQPASSALPTVPAKVIRYEPELAFGTGSHPTTQLAARSIVSIAEHNRGIGVLDVGTGNGVLALVALVSGAERALGLDIDPRAIAAAQKNAALNGLDDRVRFETTPLAQIRDSYDLVVANIDARTLFELAPALCARTKSWLLLTGLLKEQRAQAEQRFAAERMFVSDCHELDDWCLLCLERQLSD